MKLVRISQRAAQALLGMGVDAHHWAGQALIDAIQAAQLEDEADAKRQDELDRLMFLCQPCGVHKEHERCQGQTTLGTRGCDCGCPAALAFVMRRVERGVR